MSVQLAKNTAYLTLASVGQKLIALIYFLFLARVMRPELTGTYFLVVSIAMIFSVISDFGITPVTIREIAKNPNDTQKIVRRALSVKIPLLLTGFLCTILAALWLDYGGQVVWLTAIPGLSLLLDSIHLFFYGVLRGHQQLRTESAGMFLGQLVVGIVGGISLWLLPSMIFILIALVAGSVFHVIFSGATIAKHFGKAIFVPMVDKAYAKKLLGMAFPFALAAIFVKVYSYVDTLFISKLLDTTAVGLYSIAYKMTYAFQFIPLAFTAALYPNFCTLFKTEPQKIAGILRRALWYMMLVSTPIVFGLWLIAKPAVALVGDTYAQAASVLSVLVFVLIPIFLDFPIGALLNAAGRQSTKTAIMGGTMVLNIILNALLIPKLGVLGAAYAALAGFLFMFFVGLYFVKKILRDFPFKLFIRDVILVSMSGAVMVIVGRMLLERIHWLLVIPICAMVYMSGLCITRSLTKNDWLAFKHMLHV